MAVVDGVPEPPDSPGSEMPGMRGVVGALLNACIEPEEEVRIGAAYSLAQIAGSRPLVVLTEWHAMLSKEKQQSELKETPRSKRKSTSTVTTRPGPVNLLVYALAPVMDTVTEKGCLQAGDVRHRAVLGQVVAALVEEMVGREEEKMQTVARTILVGLAANYMDKVMDVLLVHYQPSSLGTVQHSVVATLSGLAYSHPHGMVPFLKAILSTTCHVLKGVKVQDIVLRTNFCVAIANFANAILDYVSNIGSMPDPTVALSNFHTEANSIYETLFSSWLQSSKETSLRLQVLQSMASITPLLSSSLMSERAPQFLTSLLQLYKRIGGSGSCLEVTLCISPLLELVTTTQSSLLEPVLDPLFNTMFQQVCIVMDFEKPNTVKNHNEILRCYDIMMRHSPDKLVTGLLNKADHGEERMRVGALLVIRHILNMTTDALGERLEAILAHLTSKLGENNPNVQKVLAQIIVLLGHHGCIEGSRGRELVGFIIRLCTLEGGTGLGVQDSGSGSKGVITQDSLGVMCGNILQLLTTSVPSTEAVLWPHTLDYLLQPDSEEAVPAVSRALAHLVTRRSENSEDLTVDWGDFQYAVGPSPLLARLLVLASVPGPGNRGIHILRFLLKFSPSINRLLGEVWEARFPLLLHYLEQQGDSLGEGREADLTQWHNWILDLVTDSAKKVGMEDWTLGLCSALVTQLSLYPSKSREKSFSIRSVGKLLTLITNKQAVMDNLSSIFLSTVERRHDEAALASAFGSVASTHLELVLSKCCSLYLGQSVKKSTFFGLIRDREGEETQTRVIAIVLQCVGQAAVHAKPSELETNVESMVKTFLLPCLKDSKDSNHIREAVLIAVSELSSSLQAVLKENPLFKLARNEDLLHSAISVLQDQAISLSAKQLALSTLTSLIQLPPNISQLARCSLLKACFSTIFNAFLDATSCKAEDYEAVADLERSISAMVEKLHILIKELLRQDMEQSTVDEIFTMLEPWLRLEQDLARELSVNILLRALNTYLRGVTLGVNSPSNFTPGPYMIGAMVARCHDPSRAVRTGAVECVQALLRTLALYEGLPTDKVEQALGQLDTINVRCNGEDREDLSCLTQGLVTVLGSRMQHHHLLSLLDSLCEAVMDTQLSGAEGVLTVLLGLVTARGSEVFQNIPGFVRKLHDKMELMAMDELSDLSVSVAGVVAQFTVHSTRGAISALLHLEAPPMDQAARLIWQTLAVDERLSGDVLDVLLETITQQDLVLQEPVSPVLMAAVSAITVMLDTHRLEEICRLELSRILSGLVMLLAQTVGKTTVAMPLPTTVCLDAIRALWSCCNCVVVASSLPTVCTDLNALVNLLVGLVQSVSTHAAHHLPAVVSGFTGCLPTNQEVPECRRVASLAVLEAAVEAKAAGDLALLASIVTTVLRSASDPSPLARRLALHAVTGLANCSSQDIEHSAALTLSVLLQALDDDQCPTVTLTALKSLVTVIPILPAHHVTPVTATATLKVRPYFESSSEEHRAAAIAVYGAFAGFAKGEQRTSYLEHAQGWLVPVLLHSSSSHTSTAQACLGTLRALAQVTQFQPLHEALSNYSPDTGFPALVELVISQRCGEVIEMYPNCVASGLSYFQSTNPLLRGNVVILMGAIMEATRGRDVGEEMVQAVTQGIMGLLSDPDREVRRVAACTVGKVVTATMNPLV